MLLKSKYVSRLRLNREDGIFPFKLFPFKSRCSKSVKSPSDEGNVPPILVLLKVIIFRDDNIPMLEGIEPPKSTE